MILDGVHQGEIFFLLDCADMVTKKEEKRERLRQTCKVRLFFPQGLSEHQSNVLEQGCLATARSSNDDEVSIGERCWREIIPNRMFSLTKFLWHTERISCDLMSWFGIDAQLHKNLFKLEVMCGACT